MRYGPTKPPIVPTELMKASPPAAAMPVRKRGGIVQKIPRAALMPVSATVTNVERHPEVRGGNRAGKSDGRRQTGQREVDDLAAALVHLPGPDNHADSRHHVATARDKPDLEIREVSKLDDLRQKETDAVGSDEKSELHAREDEDPRDP